MGDVYFYHLTSSTLEAMIPVLISRAENRDWRSVIRARDPARLDWLDRFLWEREGFLPHGQAGGPHDADQPVLLTTGRDVPNGASFLIAFDGAEISAEETSGFERSCLLFEGADEAAVEAARNQWRRLTGAGVAAQYWSEDGGGWSKKAESGSG